VPSDVITDVIGQCFSWGKLSQHFIDRAIGQWRRRRECVVQQQGGHLMQKLQDVTVTLDDN